MAADLEVTIDWKAAEVVALMRRLQPPRLHQALSVGVNATAKQIKVSAARRVAKAGRLKRGDVDPSITIYPYSKPSTLTAVVRGSGRPIALMKFDAKMTKKGVTANAWGPRKLYKGTFIAKMASGHTGVFVREGPKKVLKKGRYKGKVRQGIKELWGSGVTQVMSQAIVLGELEAEAKDKLTTNVVRQLKRYAFKR